ncbi:hypothetical protein M0D46_15200 [Xanthomonas prunicola]|nr:hypothetical protein [Xanthomonas prunicola]UXA62644.1 hypothetical protein M0D48_06650 [Xanthomonas prunicola]UXA68434.1 hypothetical protein M0D46_15200 [Xanthomonas prunicola]
MRMWFLDYASALIGCWSVLPSDEREHLRAQEFDHLGGPEDYGTSDWPGWEKCIGKSDHHSRRSKTLTGRFT